MARSSTGVNGYNYSTFESKMNYINQTVQIYGN